LFELNGQGFFQGQIEYRVSGVVGEVGEDELVFVSEPGCLMYAPIEAANDAQRDQYNDGRRYDFPIQARLANSGDTGGRYGLRHRHCGCTGRRDRRHCRS